jgi:ketosteroid isomerase-like protein
MSKKIAANKSFVAGLAVASLMLIALAGAAQAGTEDEIKALFEKFVTAQNAHDLKAVGEILLDSPEFLWITRDAQTGRPSPHWGRDAALKRFEQYYQGTWKLEPKLDEAKIAELAPGVVELVAPTLISIAPAGQTAQPGLFLLNHIYVKTAAGWRLASIFPIFVR